MAVDVISAQIKHMQYVLEHLRDQDRREIEGAGENARLRGFALYADSERCYAVVAGDRPIAVFGCVRLSLLQDAPIVWLLGTTEICKCGFQFARKSKAALAEVIDAGRYAGLTTLVDAENKVSQRWLTWLGFDISPTPTVIMGDRKLHYAYFYGGN